MARYFIMKVTDHGYETVEVPNEGNDNTILDLVATLLHNNDMDDMVNFDLLTENDMRDREPDDTYFHRDDVRGILRGLRSYYGETRDRMPTDQEVDEAIAEHMNRKQET